ncbi:MraY family glycosyltransferase [Crocinitomix algicola]|uniref:MraY family glycosyltransferase n=1 Tax=Crocinitomix algicola TaxID=1740263 RepID=UPI000873127B|nr:MraY family glycosyltransferase [Crocinitomix algicola]
MLLSFANILLFFGGAFLLSLIINVFFLRFSRTLGIRNKNHLEIRWSSISKPSLGGISFYITYLMSFMLYAIIFGESDVFQNKSLLGVFCAMSLAFLLGLSDDAYDTRPKIKFLAQIACGVLLIFTDNQIDLFPWEWFNYFATVFWVVAIMNSINMLDNMDAISTVASIFIILSMIGIAVPFSFLDNVDYFLLIAILGSLCSFLIFNWNPSKMFMGDTGSQFLGMFLAYYSIKLLWNNGINVNDYSIVSNFTLVVITFSVPIIDTIFVVIRRVRRGQSPAVGGKDHTTHTLFYKGFSDRQVAYVFIILGIISCLISLNVAKYIPKNSFALVLVWIYIFTILLTIFKLVPKDKKRKK